MFWKFNLLKYSQIETLLEKEDVTLRELMEEDDILQECKAVNRKLVDFLVQPENMEEMVKLITVEPPDDIDEKLRFKYPNTACELLTSDVTEINEKLSGDTELVDKLYAFLEGDKPLNPLLASFFSKVMGLLITRKSEMVYEYLKGKNDFVGRLLYHIGTSAVMDLLLRLITCIESSETRRAVIEWLNQEKIVEKLVDSIVVDKDEDIHCNAAQSLCDIVRLGREQFMQQQDPADPDPLLVTMELEETVSRLLSNMFDSEKNESVLVNGLCVIHTLLEVRRQGSEVTEQLPNGDASGDRFTQGINNVIAAIVPRLKDFHDLLLNPPKQRYSLMPTSVECLEPPLGNTRLQVAKLVTALVGANMHQVNTELAALGTIQTLLDLYFKYPWNNFLHTQVEQCLLIILNNGPIEIDGKHEHPLLTKLFSEYNLVERLLAEWEDNDEKQKAPSGRRKGFMGHLTKIANSISGLVEKSETPSLVKDQFNGLSEECKKNWEAFVAGSLSEINTRNTIDTIRGNALASSSEDDDTDFKDIPFPQDTAIQQAFSDYQLQQMTSNFIDQFGFNDEEFAEQEEKIEAAFLDRISSINSDIQVNNASQQSSVSLFEQLCNERIQQFDNDDSDEDIWEEKPITFNKSAQQARSERLQGETARCHSSDEDSTDSGEELDSPVKIAQQPSEGMDTSENPWSSSSDSSPAQPERMDTTASPWDKAAPGAPGGPDEGWASFGTSGEGATSAPSADGDSGAWADFTCFSDLQGASDAPGPRSSSPVAMDTTEGARGSAYVVPDNDAEVSESKDNEASTLAVTVTLPGTTTGESSDMRVTDLECEEETKPQPDSTSPGLSPADATPAPPASPGQSVLVLDSEVSSTSTDSSQSEEEPLPPTPSSPNSGSSVDAAPPSPAQPASEGQQASPVPVSESSEANTSSPSFLAASGLMKSPRAASPRAPPAGSNGSPASSATPQGEEQPDTTDEAAAQAQLLEQARAQAKEAQELYESATTATHNGPV